MKLAQNQLLLVYGHVVAEVIETQLVISYIGDVTGISCLPLLASHAVEDDSDAQAEEAMNLPHPLRVTLGQIVVDRDNLDSLSVKGVQV